MLDNLIMGQSDPTMLVNLAAFIIGLILHICKKCYIEEISARKYLISEIGRTTLSGLGLISAFVSVNAIYPGAGLLIYLLSGYSIDSLLNKAPKAG